MRDTNPNFRLPNLGRDLAVIGIGSLVTAAAVGAGIGVACVKLRRRR